MTFLPNPAKIRKCLVQQLGKSVSLDAAVAFIGRDWADIIGTFSGPIRVVCWLSSTNTNPYAVEQMMSRENICVHQLPAMHARVYILEGEPTRCVVGSENLTSAALSEENASGQYEAGVNVRDRRKVNIIRSWFEELWDEASPISPFDLESAKKQWELARSKKKDSDKRKTSAGASQDVGSVFPVNWKSKRELLNLANDVRTEDFSDLDKYTSTLSRIVENGRRRDVKELIEFVAEWTSHEGKYRPALNEPRGRIRKAFKVLFDHSRSIESRLHDLDSNGTCKIPGFGLASLTMILYWRVPTEYPPFNRRTQLFLKDFGFEGYIPKALSPTQFGKWIAFAQELSARLQLPSTGHVDRLVWSYTDGRQI